jgi:hypothetical protein
MRNGEEQKKMTRPGGWSMAKDATLGGRWSLPPGGHEKRKENA